MCTVGVKKVSVPMPQRVLSGKIKERTLTGARIQKKMNKCLITTLRIG